MKTQLSLALIFLLVLGTHQGIAQETESENKPIEFGKWDAIQSDILGEERKIMVYTPRGPKDAKYPVVYLLDGDGHYYSVAGMIRQLSSVNGNTAVPKMIVVAIPNTNRTRDLTPFKGDPTQPFVNSKMIENSGGGETFMAFIEKELIPYVEENYPTQPYRTFIGHSLGGLTVMNAWLNHTALFNAYIAIDPSMWWGKGVLAEEIMNTPIDKKFDQTSLIVAIANTMGAGMDTATVQTSQSPDTEHIRAILELHKYLDKHAGKYLDYMGRYYHEDTHGSVPLIAEYDAFRFIFADYSLTLGPAEIMNPDVDFTVNIREHYEKATKKYGFSLKPEEGYVNMIGYTLMEMKQHQKAESFFKLNVEYYPESDNVYDSLGDCYIAMGEKEKAAENFKKSISLNENSPSKEKLAKLEEE